LDIFVAIKQVPDTDKVKINPETGTMIREGVDSIVNPLDLYAIEVAIRLKEQHGGKITAFTMGPLGAEKALKEAIAMGCDAGALITDRAFSGSDTWATSCVLSHAVAAMGHYDMILVGERATDGDTGQVGPCLAAWLGIPILTYIGSLEVYGSTKVTARRLVEEGYQKVEADLPCLVTVVKEIATPRLPTLRGKKFARQTGLTLYSAADLHIDSSCVGLKGSPTKVAKIFYPKVTRGGKVVRALNGADVEAAVDKLIAFLDEHGLIEGVRA
jgi:electron transfer flavoprotein beta subunit